MVLPRTVDGVAPLVRDARLLLPVGAQSSLTGGATPMGGTVLSTEKLTRVISLSGRAITVEAGVTVAAMQAALAAHDAWFPPAPTYTGACAGGIVATNAAGAATFKYGAVRDWVQGLTVVLADGSTLALERGQIVAEGRRLSVPGAAGAIEVAVPGYRMPDVVKRSAGYHAAADMDLVNLLIGSEGTLGVITTVTFRVLSPAPTSALALVPCGSEPDALALVGELREHPDCVAAIEHMDGRCLAILKEDGADRRADVRFPEGTALALLVQLELPAATTEASAFDEIASAAGGGGGPLARICRILDCHGVFDSTEMALPGQLGRSEQLVALREAVPAGVNQRVGRAQREIDPRIAKTAADMIVPFDRFGEMMAVYRRGFAERGLDFAVWGHISDGNVHPNVLPRSYEEAERGKDAILFFGREVARLGGCPLAEHGVGRNQVKQALLRGLYGESGIDEMRAVKRALDPGWKLAPGVIFTATAA